MDLKIKYFVYFSVEITKLLSKLAKKLVSYLSSILNITYYLGNK